jgi:hypothetical protein
MATRAGVSSCGPLEVGSLGACVADGIAETVAVGVGLAVGEGVGVCEGVGDGVGVAVGIGSPVFASTMV